MHYLMLVLLFVSTMMQPVSSRPVSYPGGFTADLNNNEDAHSLLVHYSPSAKHSFGLRSEYRHDGEFSLTSLQFNNLIRRWNKKDSQANFYLKSGVGYADRNSSRFNDDSGLAAYTGIAMDWETRRYFTSYENRYVDAGSISNFFMQKIRVGFAPYIADYNALHTWFMLELEHEPEDSDVFTARPLVRFFKDVHLIEAGISSNNDVLFNWTIRF